MRPLFTFGFATVLFFLVVLFCSAVLGQDENAPAFKAPFAEPEDFQAIDMPNDSGSGVILTWKVMPYDGEGVVYIPLVAETERGKYFPQEPITSTGNLKSDIPAAFGYSDKNKAYHAVGLVGYKIPKPGGEPGELIPRNFAKGVEYFFKLQIKWGDGEQAEVFDGSTIARATIVDNWFYKKKLNTFLVMLFFCSGIMFFINLARRNPNLFVRRISGLEAVEDALGRATEMGKSVLFVHGINQISELPAIASINILSKIAEKVAEYDTDLKVTNIDPIMLQVSQETVKQAYIKAGRPDAYKAENVFFAAADQFSYAAAVDGIMMRERPAANFYFGYFYAESLLLSETGANCGAIQIAGTDAWTQIPFFITTCDYTLIGEELYAASAYLAREPKMLGSLKGQDFGKAFILIVVILGTLLVSMGYAGFAQWFWTA
ncbi:DUF6754 domain-containing protein [Planctomycetota bacterium]